MQFHSHDFTLLTWDPSALRLFAAVDLYRMDDREEIPMMILRAGMEKILARVDEGLLRIPLIDAELLHWIEEQEEFYGLPLFERRHADLTIPADTQIDIMRSQTNTVSDRLLHK